MSSTYTRQRSSSMNSINSNHSSYSTPQPPPINILSPHSAVSTQTMTNNSSPYSVLPSLNTQQQQQQQPHNQCLRQSASPGLVSSSSSTTTTSNSNTFEPPQSSPTNTHANSISPTSTSATTTSTLSVPGAASTTTLSNNNNSNNINKNDITSTPTFSSANISSIQNVAPTPSSTRSMSIVSLERSARNSIVSVDENLRYHTRNDSSASLASLGHVNHNTLAMTPIGNSSSGGATGSNRHSEYGLDQGNGDSRMRFARGVSGSGSAYDSQRSGSAILTDDESEYDANMTASGVSQSSDTLRTIPTTPVLGATTTNTSSMGQVSRGMTKPMHRPKRRSFKDDISLQHLKNDFKFKFHDMYTAGAAAAAAAATASPTTIPTTPVSYHHPSSQIYSLNASPTSDILMQGGKSIRNDSPLDDSQMALTSPSLSQDPIGKQHLDSPEIKSSIQLPTSSSSFNQPSGSIKKMKSASLIQQSLYLKKKLAFSKDLQIEFNIASDSNNTTSIASAPDHTCSSKGALHSHLITMSPPLSTALSDAKFFAHLPPPSSNMTMPGRRRLSSSLNETAEAAKTTPTSAGASGEDSNPNDGANVNNELNLSTNASVLSSEQDTSRGHYATPLTPLRAMQSVKEQNELITKLNKKWNKSMINSSTSNSSADDGGNSNSKDDSKFNNSDDNLVTKSASPSDNSKFGDTNILHMNSNNRKRSRRDSFEDDTSFDDFNYDDHYDK
ncbi:hypothetical protein I9W82_005296 [Candida metapsilosis]|uniref:Uncharacterized protein n=1 Tax=Candida metapsilosis TaxID=273372 RepID=A0A8H7ZDY2_9ASCO|nr:hypothetical protein I9W82_005296 [Candida metapsilosis]